MIPFLKKTAEFFCFSRKQQRGLMVLSVLLWLTLAGRIWFFYHPVRHVVPSGLLAQAVTPSETPPNNNVPSAANDSSGRTAALADERGRETPASGRDVAQPLAGHHPDGRTTGKQAGLPSARDRAAGIQRIRMDINTADTTMFMALRGIGRTYARRMVAYRELLGGYVRIDQLKEVYGIRSGLVDTLAPQLKVDTSRIRRIELMEAAYRDLLRHPYLDKIHVENIRTYIAINKGIRRTEELLENKVLDSQTYRLVRPYLHSPDDGTEQTARNADFLE